MLPYTSSPPISLLTALHFSTIAGKNIPPQKILTAEGKAKLFFNHTLWHAAEPEQRIFYYYTSPAIAEKTIIYFDGDIDVKTIPLKLKSINTDKKTGKTYWEIIRCFADGSYPSHHIYYFPQESATSLGNCYYQDPEKDEEGNFIAETGMLYEKTDKII